MSLRATHYGYTYQDLLTGVALVDLMIGNATEVVVDTKGFDGDRFDDITIVYRSGSRVRVQIKHTEEDRQLARSTFSADGRSLKLNLLFDSLLKDRANYPGTTYRLVVRDGAPDVDLAAVLRPLDPISDPGDPLPGILTQRYRFDVSALQTTSPWSSLLSEFTEEQVAEACASLIVDTGAPSSTINLAAPGPAELALLRRAIEELGAGRPPNAHREPIDVALQLVHAATSARAQNGAVRREDLSPRIGLISDFGAVAQGHPVEKSVEVARDGAIGALQTRINGRAAAGGCVVLTGEPGTGKSWLSEQLATSYSDAGWIVVRHHCWLGSSDLNRDERVLAEVVIGSLLSQIERLVPEAVHSVRPRYAATRETLESAIRACLDLDADRKILVIVDGLDHADRVLGRNTAGAPDPSRVLVDALGSIGLPPRAVLLIASQPGPHLESVTRSSDEPISMPLMSWQEVGALATRHHLIDEDSASVPEEQKQIDREVVNALFERSAGNALYATYLCRSAARVSPFDIGPQQASKPRDLLRRIEMVPAEATDLDSYYEHLLTGLTDGQILSIGALAVCDFALSADELGEMVPEVSLLLGSALRALAPALNSQPGLGGLKVHHESFSRYILRGKSSAWVSSIREKAVTWLRARGFFVDARAFRHLPGLLAELDRYEEVRELLDTSFVGNAIEALQPPEALKRFVSTVAHESEMRLDWPTLATCIETRKAIDVYETQSLEDTLLNYADVVVSVLGVERVAERLLYEGRVTFPADWGLRLCETVDRAGGAAPWEAYLLARDRENQSGQSVYRGRDDGGLRRAVQLGSLRVRGQRAGFIGDYLGRVAAHLDGLPTDELDEMIDIFAAGLPSGAMPEVATRMTNVPSAARTHLVLADLASVGEPDLPPPHELARRAFALDPGGDLVSYLRHGIAPEELLVGLEIDDFKRDLDAATEAVLDSRMPEAEVVAKWLAVLEFAHALDRSLPVALGGRVAGVGFYRAWLQFAISSVGIASDVSSGILTPEDASTTIRLATEQLAQHAEPFTGSPRACDLYAIHPLIHQVVEDALRAVRPDDLDPVLEHLTAIGKGTSTSLMGMAASGPLTTNDLLDVLARAGESIGTASVHALIGEVRVSREGLHDLYSVEADFELGFARICHIAGATEEAETCWNRAAPLLAAYGGHKDPTLTEFIDSVPDLAGVSVAVAREALSDTLDLAYLVRQHTDGRGTNHVVQDWWTMLARIDPIAAGLDGAHVWLQELGFEDARVQAGLESLLELELDADPVAIAALRLAAGSDWRRPEIDLQITKRLRDDYGRTSAGDAVLSSVANNIAASYDDQPRMHSSGTTKSVATNELVDAVTSIGGTAFSIREANDEAINRGPSLDDGPDTVALLKTLESRQRPVFPAGRDGAVLAARDYNSKRYDDDPSSARWSRDGVVNAIGWRVLETVQIEGVESGLGLIDEVASELSSYGDNTILAVIGEGLAARASSHEELKSIAAYCLTLAYTRIRGGGGWRNFAGREQVRLWTLAYELDSNVAERTLAAAVSKAAQNNPATLYGITQGVVAAFAAQPAAGSGGTAIECWKAGLNVLKNRLPGAPERTHHSYEPLPVSDNADDLDNALATLAIASISQAARADLRRALLAATLLLLCRPAIAQTALVRVFGHDLDAARSTWLLELLRDYLPPGELTDELASALIQLCQSDLLSVRVLASDVLATHRRPVPFPKVTEPAPAVRQAFAAVLQEDW